MSEWEILVDQVKGEGVTTFRIEHEGCVLRIRAIDWSLEVPHGSDLVRGFEGFETLLVKAGAVHGVGRTPKPEDHVCPRCGTITDDPADPTFAQVHS